MNDMPVTFDSFTDFWSLLSELDNLSDEMLAHPKVDDLWELIEKFKKWGCRTNGKHDWQYDHCGYWQHQYCIKCNEAKYPDLVKQSCNELTAKMGKMSEAKFLLDNI